MFNSAHGTADELALLVQKTHEAGLQIYADMVLNHMCSNRNFTYPRFHTEHFHRFGAITNPNDQWQRENGDLLGLEDLAQESPYVRGELWEFLVKTNNMGFDGYRWDAAKHVPRIDDAYVREGLSPREKDDDDDDWIRMQRRANSFALLFNVIDD